MKPTLLIVLLLVVLSACATTPVSAPATQFASVNGHRVAYRLAGSGRPTIVFEAGFGGEMSGWDTVAPAIARLTQTFAYDRPGRGQSDPTPDDGDGMRTSTEVVHTLHATLAAAHVRPPYILVGVSLGGLYIQKFAQLYPREVIGLVLVDNRPAAFQRECVAAYPAICHDSPVDPTWSPATQATYRGIASSEAEAPSPQSLGNIPVTVITATVPIAPEQQQFLPIFQAAQTRFAQQLQNGRQVMAEGASHETLTGDHPQYVIGEITRMVGQLRR